jgi:polysaccharide deacetylase 2 family uncharacterized protein YibQ
MAAKRRTVNRGALVLGLAWLVVLIAGGAVALAVQVFGRPHVEQVVTGALPPLARSAKPVAPLPPPALPTAPAPTVFETPPGGIVPAQLSAAEKAAVAAQPPPASAAAQPAPQDAASPVLPPVILPPVRGGVAVANPAVLEKTPLGLQPRISDSGLWPMQAYATPIAASGNRPRIAIVIGGLGVSARSTQAAINLLPSGVTLAFAPYASDVQNWVALARQKGHEVLLQVPMEPYDFPDSDPGQYTLRTAVGEEANTRRLSWSLTRFTGYVGVTNMLGGRFLSEAAPLEPMMTYLMRRGLLFYDNGAATRSVAPQVAERLGAPFVQASATIDSIQAAMEIDHRLSDLETEARSKGKAAGSGFLYPVTVERVTLWARGLGARGFVLAPISAIVATGKK